MKLSKPINFQNVEELSRALQAGRASRERFSLELSERDCANGIYAAMKQEVEYRGGVFNLDEDTRAHILTAAQWLINPDSTPGLLMCGLYGNGKTTMAKAISRLIGYLSERELGYSNRKSMRLYTAKEICRLCASGSEYDKVFTNEMIIIDDLGEEPKEVMVYGMLYTPLIDIISERYATQRMTIITTNLDVDALKEKYGNRIYDRFREMFTPIVFENESYRKPAGTQSA